MARGPKPRFGSLPPGPKPGRTLDFSEEFGNAIGVEGIQFRSNYPGKCADCGRQFPVGEMVRKVESGEYVAIHCCGGEIEESPDALLEDGELLTEDIRLVMPAGKTRADMCMKCFQIPASSGACGC